MSLDRINNYICTYTVYIILYNYVARNHIYFSRSSKLDSVNRRINRYPLDKYYK